MHEDLRRVIDEVASSGGVVIEDSQSESITWTPREKDYSLYQNTDYLFEKIERIKQINRKRGIETSEVIIEISPGVYYSSERGYL